MPIGPAFTLLAITNTTDGAGNAGLSFRESYGSLSGSADQIRVTFEASTANGAFQVDHCSIAVIGGSTYPNVDSTNPSTGVTQPVELLFSGASGFNIAQSGTLASDWMNLKLRATDTIAVIFDHNSISGGAHRRTAALSYNAFSKAASASYNVASVTGYTGEAISRGVKLIEGRVYIPPPPRTRNFIEKRQGFNY